MSKDSSAKYYQKKKKKDYKKPCNIVMNGTKSSLKMKSKSWLTIEKIF